MSGVADSAVNFAYDAGSESILATQAGETEPLGSVFLGAASAASDLDASFVLTSGYLVFFMQCGFAMLSVGSIRSKNAKNIILKNLLDACFGGLFFYLIGFGFAYGGDYGDPDNGNSFIGFDHFALHNVSRDAYYSWFFQFAFAATAATIVSGAVAERCKFEGYIAYAIFLTSWVYPVVVHWVWSTTGWLSAFKEEDKLFDVGLIDFAGCGVVHMVGGFAGLAGAIAVGPRIGKFDADGKPTTIPGHNASLAILGVFILWFGWYGFNPGSALAIIGASEVVGLCAVTTTLSAAAATVSTIILLAAIEFMKTKHLVWDLIGASNGTLTGLVGITAACSVVEPWAAIVIGILSGFVYVFASFFVESILKVDDPLDAVAVHGFGGMFGLLFAATFAAKDLVAAAYDDYGDAYGWVMGGNGRLLGTAVVAILVILLWTLGHMLPFFFVLKALGLLRVDAAEEMSGLDVSHHGGSAYEAGGKDTDSLVTERLAALEQEIQLLKKK